MARKTITYALNGGLAIVLLISSEVALAELPRLEFQSNGYDLRLTAGVAGQAATFDDDDPSTQAPDAIVEVFARFTAQWTSPDGLLIGASIEQNNRDRESEVLNTGEVYGFFASDYGRLEVGKQDGPADTLAFAAPVVALGQVRGEFSRYAGTQALLKPLDTRDSFKVIYLSPPVGGLRAGVSWSPRVRQNARAADPQARIILDDAVELGLQYQQPVGDWIVGASGSYAFGNADPVTTRVGLDSWSIGTEARRGPLRFGGAYVRRGNSNRLDRTFDQWEVNGGISWVEVNWGVALSNAYTSASGRSNRLYGIGGYYRLTPNIELRSDIVRFRESVLNLPTDKGLVGVLELQLTI